MRARILIFTFAALAGLLLLVMLRQPPILTGDGREYFAMLAAFRQHGTPDVRAQDVEATTRLAAANGYDAGEIQTGFFPARDGRLYGYHFWFYSLLAVPFDSVLRLIGRSGFRSFQLLNASLVLGAIAVVLSLRSIPRNRRVALVALAVISPVLWYVRWPHPEVSSWAFSLIAVACLLAGRHTAAVLSASIASLQNPPLIFLAAATGAVALCKRENWRVHRLVGLAAALAVGLIPSAFYLWKFGTPNLIAKLGYSRVELITPTRVASVFFDLNQGLLPYAPVLLVLALFGVFRIFRRPDVTKVALLLALLVAVVSASTTTNWNSGCDGLMRYGVWMIPMVAGLALPVSISERGRAIVFAFALTFQTFLVVFDPLTCQAQQPGGRAPYLTHSLPARIALCHLPRSYNPEPEIFVDRTIGRDFGQLHWPLPVAFSCDGRVTKILADRTTLPAIVRDYEVDPAWLLSEQQAMADQMGLFYVHPPSGAVKVRP